MTKCTVAEMKKLPTYNNGEGAGLIKISCTLAIAVKQISIIYIIETWFAFKIENCS